MSSSSRLVASQADSRKLEAKALAHSELRRVAEAAGFGLGVAELGGRLVNIQGERILHSLPALASQIQQRERELYAEVERSGALPDSPQAAKATAAGVVDKIIHRLQAERSGRALDLEWHTAEQAEDELRERGFWPFTKMWRVAAKPEPRAPPPSLRPPPRGPPPPRPPPPCWACAWLLA